MTKNEFLNLFSDVKHVLDVINNDFILKELYSNIVDFSDFENSLVMEFLGLLSDRLQIDVKNLIYDKIHSFLNRYLVPLNGRSVDVVLNECVSKANGRAVWVGEINDDFVEIFVSNGELFL